MGIQSETPAFDAISGGDGHAASRTEDIVSDERGVTANSIAGHGPARFRRGFK
jgi:hypothetical protein